VTSIQTYSNRALWNYAWPVLLLTALLVLAIFLSLGLGAVDIPPTQVWAVLNPQTPENSINTATQTIVWDFRLARVLLVALVGAALGGAGAALQGLFRNPLADPFVIGA